MRRTLPGQWIWIWVTSECVQSIECILWNYYSLHDLDRAWSWVPLKPRCLYITMAQFIERSNTRQPPKRSGPIVLDPGIAKQPEDVLASRWLCARRQDLRDGFSRYRKLLNPILYSLYNPACFALIEVHLTESRTHLKYE